MERPGLCWEKIVCFRSPSSCLYVGFIFLKGITGYGTGSSRYILWVSLTWEKNISSICSSNCLGLTFTGSDWPGVAHGPIPEPIIVSTVSETHPWISETGLASPESTGLRVQGGGSQRHSMAFYCTTRWNRFLTGKSSRLSFKEYWHIPNNLTLQGAYRMMQCLNNLQALLQN